MASLPGALRPSTESSCGFCGRTTALRGALVFAPRVCPGCGRVGRAREKIGGYRLHELLARSGLGMTFRAEDSAGGSLAVKVLQPPLAASHADVDYFASEVWALARLNHPNCLRIFASGVEHGTAWIAMEWLPRGSLAARLAERGRLREAEVLSIGLQAAAALGAAAAAGHLHRDLEPNNLLFADARTVKLSDFGQAALYQLAADDLHTMWGRTAYVSPERLRAEPEEAYSDIYSLGAVLYHALVGIPVHGGEPNGLTKLELVEAGEIRIEDSVGGLHEKTVETINGMLASEPTQRFQRWSDVTAALTQAGTLVARQVKPASAPARAAIASPAAAQRPPASGAGKWKLLAAAVVLVLLGLAAWKLQPTPAPSSSVVAPRSTP